jgi:hypothetical protein
VRSAGDKFVPRLTRRSFLRTGLLAACSLLGGPLRAQDDRTQIAYRIKAGFLFNFLKFTDWPEAASAPGSPYRIAVAADDITFALIAGALAGKTVQDRAVSVTRATDASPGNSPHLLFLARSAPPAARALANDYTARPVLTVGETEGFARQGGILNFVLVEEAVRFEVNLVAAQRAGLRISSRISKMAILVRPEK